MNFEEARSIAWKTIAEVLGITEPTDVLTGASSATSLRGDGTWQDHGIFTDNITLPKTSGKGIQVDTAAATFPWRDLEGIIKEPPVGAGSPSLTAFRGNIKGMAFTTNDTYDLVYHMPHDYVPGSDLHIHVHWAHNDTAISGDLVLTYYITYAKGHNQAVYPAEITITQTIATTDVTTTPRWGHRLNEVQLSAASPSASQIDTDDLEPDGFIKAHFVLTTLPTLSGGSGKIFVDHIDIHYQSSNVGTKQKDPIGTGSFYV